MKKLLFLFLIWSLAVNAQNCDHDTALPEDSVKVAELLTGKTIYSKTRSWENVNRPHCTTGYKYYPLTITKITPCNGMGCRYKFQFKPDGYDAEYYVECTLNDFFIAFTFCNPKEMHKGISDKDWKAIQEADPELGMSPELVVLALGEPNEKSKHKTEARELDVWRYRSVNGKPFYLLFEKGQVKIVSNNDHIIQETIR